MVNLLCHYRWVGTKPVIAVFYRLDDDKLDGYLPRPTDTHDLKNILFNNKEIELWKAGKTFLRPRAIHNRERARLRARRSNEESSETAFLVCSTFSR